jgi:hypothetical protein
MTALTRTPQNTNFLQPTKFTLSIDRIGTSQYFCQSANIPGINLGSAPLSYPGLDVTAPGNKIMYNQFNIRFLVDEKLQSWQDLHNWFRSIAAPTGTDERNRLTAIQNSSKGTKSPYSDGMLTILSSLNNPILRVQFYNLYPINLSDVVFDTTMSAEDTITADATFMFDYFDFQPL